jgi:hypothetical protein
MKIITLHYFALEGDIGLLASLFKYVQIGITDEGQPLRDQGIMYPPLSLKLFFLLIPLGQAVLHLLESNIMQPRRIYMATHQTRAELSGQTDPDVHAVVGID